MSNLAMMMGLGSAAGGGWSADIANASYDNVSFDMSSQTTSAISIVFGNSGSSLYMVGQSTAQMYQYTLSTPYDVSTASFDTNRATNSASSPTGIGINNDGTVIYIVSDGNDRVYQYSLSTPYDIASYNNTPTSFSISGQFIYSVGGARFNSDGTKMYLVGSGGAEGYRVFQYSLSTAFDVTTASYDSKSYSFASETNNPRDVAFNPDGTIMYMVGNFPSYGVFEYALSTPYDVSTASYSNAFADVSSQTTSPINLQFNENASKMYVFSTSEKTVFQYSV